MKKICMILFIGIFLTLGILPGCKKKLPTSPDIPDEPEIVLPTIEYFTASPESITLGEVSVLSWSTKNASSISINQGIGNVDAIGTTEVSPEESTTYTLIAKNKDGEKTASVTVTITSALREAILEIVTIPEVPSLNYYPSFDNSQGSFTIVITETNGVGGHLNYIEIIFPPDGRCVFSCIYDIDFLPYGSESYSFDVCARGIPTSMIFRSYGLDNHDYAIDIQTEILFTVDVPLKAILEISTIPAPPFFDYYPDPNDNDLLSYYHAIFTLNVTETAGVGGNVLIYLYAGSRYTGPFFSSQKEFGAFGTLSYTIDVRVSKHDFNPPPEPTITVKLFGSDNNGYSFKIELIISVVLGE